MPGLAVRVWPINRVEKHPWVQIPTGEVGLVIAQVGAPLPMGWKSGVYKPEFGQFTSVRTFVAEGAQQKWRRDVGGHHGLPARVPATGGVGIAFGAR